MLAAAAKPVIRWRHDGGKVVIGVREEFRGRNGGEMHVLIDFADGTSFDLNFRVAWAWGCRYLAEFQERTRDGVLNDFGRRAVSDVTHPVR